MEGKNYAIRSKSSTSILKETKKLFENTIGVLTPCSVKSPKHLGNLPRTTRNLSLYPPKLLNSPSSGSKYIPSYTRKGSREPIRVLSKQRIFSSKKEIKQKNQSPSVKTGIQELAVKINPRKNLIIKLQRSAPRSPIPNFIHKLASKTLTGTSHNKPKPHNQDSFLIHENFGGIPSQTILSVLDGHGMFGHQISNYVTRLLPQLLEKNFPLEGNSHTVNSPNLPVSVLSELKSSFSNTFLSIQSTLSAHKQVDATFSGTTVNLVYIHGKNLICANAGDSRAVLGRFTGEWEAFDISQDHKPSDDQERKRIERCGGRVEPVKDASGRFVGPCRVWLKHEPLPGLAMSRSIGDLLASSIGVSADPDVFFHTLGPNDKFLVIASDGIWEFVNSLACVKIVSKWFEKGNPEKAAEELCEFAVSMWKSNGMNVDDITVIVVFFRVL